ncbi:aminopeptidase p [Moniliophthora roreri MCA 2997]|uniref:Aminopeptidase p n=1 Tax=Moniliophthora roreri (strain MCA 2997) TaxID=1381753 RepID=V2X0B5_MONRO|nr:aminopeptidase p [Moniliophthora roreri MCA 2997]
MVAQTVQTGPRLTRLRELMQKQENNISAYIVPSEDQHGSEYIADCDERRAFISGFDGSAGCAIITLNEAFMFTDGRYFLQAEQQLDENWKLMKQGLPDVPTWQEFLTSHLKEDSRIGLDPTLITFADSTSISKSLKPRNSSLVSIAENLVDQVWGSERPRRPANPIVHLDLKYSGESHSSKLNRVVAAITEPASAKAPNTNTKPLDGASPTRKVLILTALDEIAWLFNLRGSDITYNPVFFSYAVVYLDGTKPRAVLFLQKEGVESMSGLGDILGQEVEIKAYDEIWSYLKTLGEKLRKEIDGQSNESKKVVLVSDKASLAVVETLGEDIVINAPSPVAALKAIKNSTELEGFRQSHTRDGVALAKYFAWLEESVAGDKPPTEWEGAEKLEKFRSELDLFKGLSFDTISSTGPNGAIIHYSPNPKDCPVIEQDQIYLCDSGAQFWDGTTDVTRTWHFGNPTDEEKRAATRVLQGHIAIDTAVFPNGTTGFAIDSWARRALWKDGLDYRHGTGHGVGHFLNVHEGPHGIGVRIVYNSTPLKAGMTVTNEPGYYADGKFGVRIENVMLVQETKTPNNFGDKGYLALERVTMCPIQTKLVDTQLLNEEEIQWLNDYHKEVWTKVSPFLKNDEQAFEWLERECRPISK